MEPIIWISILSALGGIGCLIAFAFFYRDLPRRERKNTFKHGLFMIITIWVWGIFTMINAEPYTLYIVTSVLMLLTGIVHIILLYLVHKWPKEEGWIQETLFTGMIFLLGAFGFMLIFYLKPWIMPKLGLNKLPYAYKYMPKFLEQSFRYLLNPGLIFFPLAFVMMKAWHMWLQIPEREFRGWGYRSHVKGKHYNADSLKEWSWVYFELAPNLQSNKGSIRRRAKIGENYLLGDFFQVFLQETANDPRSEKLEDLAVDAEGKAVSWLFYRKAKHWWEWKRTLDYRQTFGQNNIVEGDTILAVRVIGQPDEAPLFEAEQESPTIKIRKKPTQY